MVWGLRSISKHDQIGHGGAQNAFGARESAFCTPGSPHSDKWAKNEAQAWHAAGRWASCTGLHWSPAVRICPLWMDSRVLGPGAIFKDAHRVVQPGLH